jgi:hypothetical protein
MSDPELERIRRIFEKAVKKAGAERDRLLARLCGDDATLRARVDELLAAHGQDGDALGSPTVAAAKAAAETSKAGIWYGINATIQGGKASTIATNRVFTSESFGEDNPGSTYRYIGASVNYGHGVVSVTGNAIRGAGTERGIGLYYARGDGDGLTVASAGNVVTDIGSALATAGGNVMVTPGR